MFDFLFPPIRQKTTANFPPPLRRCRWQKAKAEQKRKLFERSEFFRFPLLLHWQREPEGRVSRSPFLAHLFWRRKKGGEPPGYPRYAQITADPFRFEVGKIRGQSNFSCAKKNC